nr:tetratricopeptide repeat protein [Roseibium sp. CAU 1639]
MHADVVGYSALMAADEDGTQAAVSRSMKRAKELALGHGGRVVGTAGDAFLAEFPSVLEAVQAARHFQEDEQTSSAAGENGPALKFRIGVNLGDVIAEGEDIFGDGVNVAARVQALAPAGGIAISSAVHDQLGNRAGMAFEDGGKHTVRNIPTPVRIFTAAPPFKSQVTAVSRGKRDLFKRLRWQTVMAVFLVAAVTAGALIYRSNLTTQPTDPIADAGGSRPVVAVLPFRERGVPETYFADGFTEDVITNLGRFGELLVLSWGAVSPYRDGFQKNSELNARYVIDGTIRRNDDHLRVSVQLTDARDGVLLWSRNYESSLTDLFNMQDRITGEVAGSMARGLYRLEQAKALGRPTDKLGAYDLVLQGRAALRRVNRNDNLQARDRFEAALALDAKYSDALAGLAWTHVNDAWWGWSEWPGKSLEEAESLLNEALHIDPNNTSAISALAELRWMQNRLEEARATCQKAIRINPNDARAYATCGGVSIFGGWIESGIEYGEMALELDPEPKSWLFTNLAVGYFSQGRFEDAEALLKSATLSENEDPAPHAVLAAVYAKLGKTEQARYEVEEALRRSPFFSAKIFAENLATTGYSEVLLSGMREAGFK